MDAQYHCDANGAQLMQSAIPALIADNQLRQRDARFKGQGKYKTNDDVLYDEQASVQGGDSIKLVKLFRPQDFSFNDDNTRCIYPAGQTLYRPGGVYTTRVGLR